MDFPQKLQHANTWGWTREDMSRLLRWTSNSALSCTISIWYNHVLISNKTFPVDTIYAPKENKQKWSWLHICTMKDENSPCKGNRVASQEYMIRFIFYIIMVLSFFFYCYCCIQDNFRDQLYQHFLLICTLILCYGPQSFGNSGHHCFCKPITSIMKSSTFHASVQQGHNSQKGLIWSKI